MSFESRLDSESERWQQDGLITDETRRAILARYPVQQTDPSRILIPLAVLTAGVGVVLLVAWNWQAFSAAVKLGLTSLLTLALYAGAARSVGRSRVAYTEAWVLAAALGSFTLFAALADVYHWTDGPAIVLWCAIGAAVTAAATGALLVTILAAVTLFWWLLVAGGTGIPWQFPLVFVLVAIAAEQSRHRAVAVLTAVCVAGWAFMMATNIWTGAMPVALFTAVAGAALEQWSQRPAHQRPIFAQATPGRSIAIGGLLFALLGAVHAEGGASGGATTLLHTFAGRSPWPSLVLLVCLAGIAMGGRRHAALMPRLIAIAAAVWFVVAAVGQLSWLGAWPWIVAFSALLLFAGATLVRESARSRNLATFAIGLTAVIGLVLVQFSSGDALRGAVVLLLSGLILFVVGRKSRQPAGGTP